ncbi:unnamed protein product [Polarella glacialis]|uniref:Uncharacterized protein n=2 Tax=Polarella glacialis TaxID=89957 RepID=A0A813FMG3_POLGL|nr:unnamed protein product [Polarella glacialis]
MFLLPNLGRQKNADKKDDFANTLIRQKLDERHLMEFNQSLSATTFILAFSVFLQMWKDVSATPRWMTTSQDVGLAAAYALTLVCLVCKERMRPKLIQWSLYSGLMLCIMLSLYGPVYEISSFLRSISFISVLRLVLRSMTDSLTIVAFWNTALSLTVLTASMNVDTHSKMCTSHMAGVFVELVVQWEVFICATSIFGFWRMKASLLDHATREVLASTAEHEHQAANVILETICDAIVELDSDLMIAEEAPRLGAMLLHGTGHSLKGTELKQLLQSDEDKQQFLSHTSGLHGSTSLAKVFHVRMRDGMGTALPVECFHMRFIGSCGKSRHLIGIREFGDGPERPPVTTDNSQASHTSDFFRGLATTVMFDPLSLEILGVSSHFHQETGIDASTNKLFINLLLPSDVQGFLKAFTNFSNEFLNSGLPSMQSQLHLNLDLPDSNPTSSNLLCCSGELHLDKDGFPMAGVTLNGSGPWPTHGQFVAHAVFTEGHLSSYQPWPVSASGAPSRASSQGRSSRQKANSTSGSARQGTRRDIVPTELSSSVPARQVSQSTPSETSGGLTEKVARYSL